MGRSCFGNASDGKVAHIFQNERIFLNIRSSSRIQSFEDHRDAEAREGQGTFDKTC